MRLHLPTLDNKVCVASHFWPLFESQPLEALLMTIVRRFNLLAALIGISALRLNWWLHGIVIGFISSIPMAVALWGRYDVMIGTLVMGMIYGILTELITSVLFKAKSTALA